MILSRHHCCCRHTKIGGDVLWRMVWLQGTTGKPKVDRGRTLHDEQRQAAKYADGDPPSDGETKIIRREALEHLLRVKLQDEENKAVSVPRLKAYMKSLSEDDQSRLNELADESSRERLERWTPPTRDDRIKSLMKYDVGQQDIGGLPPKIGGPPASIDALCCVMSWVRVRPADPCSVFCVARLYLGNERTGSRSIICLP